jgi:hypothetical protein
LTPDWPQDYPLPMSTEQLDELLSLPLMERVELAQALWQSIGGSTELEDGEDEKAALEQAWRRNAELDTRVVPGRSHEQVIEAARRALG